MGRRGPPPQPTTLKVLRGNPGKRPLNKKEPQPRVVKDLRCPSDMPDAGKKEWRRVVKELSKLGMLTAADFAALEIYCNVYSTWKEAEDFLKENGNHYKLESGYRQPYPEVAIRSDARRMCKQYQQEFGLTPSARSRMQVEERQVSNIDDDDARFFGTG